MAGFESHAKAAMNLFFIQQEQLLTLVALAQAEVLVLDMEHPVIPPLLDQYQNLCPIVAVTATEKVFYGLVTVRKPLNGKQLIAAIQRAKQEFIPASANQFGEQHSDGAVSREGEKAFQEYQQRIAAGRQAMKNYQQRTAGRESNSSHLQEQFTLKEPVVPVEATNASAVNASSDELVTGSQSDSLW
ncbi:MAG: hypothetical protein V7731_16090 [Amphritea sp.]